MGSKIIHTVNGCQLTLSEASCKYNLHRNTLMSRMFKYGLSLEDAIFNFCSKRSRISKGDRFGHLVATGNTIRNPDGNMRYEVLCDCGRITNSLGLVLKKRKSNAACNMDGCQHSSTILHGMSKTKEYNTWINIKNRCRNKKNKAYKYYGLVGIDISDEFHESFVVFLSHVGLAPSKLHSMDRIDNLKGYIRGNLRWATKKEQMNNQRDVTTLTLEIIRLKGILGEHKIFHENR